MRIATLNWRLLCHGNGVGWVFRRGSWGARVLSGLCVGLLYVGLLVDGAGATGPLQRATDDWERLRVDGVVLDLVVTDAGPLIARTTERLLRSDDGGDSWREILLPAHAADPRTWTVATFLSAPSVLYASGEGGLFKSEDGGTAWSLVLPTTEYVRGMAVSAADPGLVYVGLVRRADISGDFRFVRSRDGGANWEQLEEHHASLCGWGVPILYPHPSEANRVFRTAACLAGRDFGTMLWHSADQGASWARVFGAVPQRGFTAPETAYPRRLEGGRGKLPGRYVLAADRDTRLGGGVSVFRSDDDGVSWAEVLSLGMRGAPLPSGTADITVGGLALDPVEPDRVSVGLTVYPNGRTDGPHGCRQPYPGQRGRWGIMG